MGYGYFDEDTLGGGRNNGGGSFDPNKVTSGNESLPYAQPNGGLPGGGSAFGASPPTEAPGQLSPTQGASMGASAGPWGAIIGAAVGSLSSRLSAGSNAAAARAAIPSPYYADTLGKMVNEMGIEGSQLKSSTLGPNATAAATTVGQRSAESRGLSGPLAASVAASSVNQAQSNYNQWRLGMLQNYRSSYLGLVQQYLAALEARRQAMIQSGYADRENAYAPLPLDPFVGKPLAQGLMNATGGPGNDKSIQAMGGYNPNVPVF